jgi:hypothetical protein
MFRSIIGALFLDRPANFARRLLADAVDGCRCRSIGIDDLRDGPEALHQFAGPTRPDARSAIWAMRWSQSVVAH